jgi:hypothetical protein
MITNDTIVNADVNSAAAIAYSKLNLTGGIVTTDIANDTIVNADINTAAGIALSKLATDPLARANHTGTQTASTVSDFDTQVRTNRLDQMTAPTASVAFNAQKITGLADPTLAQDAATKAYTDLQISNLIDGAPGTLDTLNEIAAALADTANFSDTVVLKSGSTMTGALDMGTNKVTGVGDPTLAQDAATKNYVDTITLAPSNLTGPITSVGSATSIASKTGNGTKFVMDDSPTLITPDIGVATATSVNGSPIPSSKTLVVTTDKISALAATTVAELNGVLSDGDIIANTLLTATGDIIYASAANTPARLAAGTSGYVLTAAGAGVAPAWAAATGGKTLISSTAMSASSSIQLTSIVGTYKDLVVEILDFYPTTAGNNLSITLNNDTGANYADLYPNNGGGTGSVGVHTGGTVAYLATSIKNTDNNNKVVFSIPSYTDTSAAKLMPFWSAFVANDSSRNMIAGVAYWYGTPAAVTRIDVKCESNFLGGTVNLYGVN